MEFWSSFVVFWSDLAEIAARSHYRTYPINKLPTPATKINISVAVAAETYYECSRTSVPAREESYVFAASLATTPAGV